MYRYGSPAPPEVLPIFVCKWLGYGNPDTIGGEISASTLRRILLCMNAEAEARRKPQSVPTDHAQPAPDDLAVLQQARQAARDAERGHHAGQQRR